VTEYSCAKVEYKAWHKDYGSAIESDILKWLNLGNKLSPDNSVNNWVLGHFQARSTEFVNKGELK